MYYLLESNRIIDSENYKEPYILSKDVIRGREVLFLTSFKDQVSVKGTIKKQSENVYDLIEKEDLIKIKMCDTFSILEVKNINSGVSGMRHIVAIYKPDKQGNYIKVWEVKKNGRNN